MHWTTRDELVLQRAMADLAFLRAALDASIHATSLREGERARSERRDLIDSLEREVARLTARKEAAKEVA